MRGKRFIIRGEGKREGEREEWGRKEGGMVGVL